MTHKYSRFVTIGIAGVLVIVLSTVIALQQTTYPVLQSEDGIPLPFAVIERHPFLGDINTIGMTTLRDGTPVDVRDVSFANGEIFEWLKGSIHSNTLDFVRIPPVGQGGETISVGAPLCDVFSRNKRYFLYKYVLPDGSWERNNQGQAFWIQFAGDFITSAAQRAADSTISDFEQQFNVTFDDACAHSLEANALYLAITNDALTAFQARNLPCGNGTQQFPEQCDDGNRVSEDGCSNACRLEFCGDGIHQDGLGEKCDDGNTANGDGCSSTCQLEASSSSSSSALGGGSSSSSSAPGGFSSSSSSGPSGFPSSSSSSSALGGGSSSSSSAPGGFSSSSSSALGGGSSSSSSAPGGFSSSSSSGPGGFPSSSSSSSALGGG